MNTEQLLSDRLMAFIREMNEWEVTAYHESKNDNTLFSDSAWQQKQTAIRTKIYQEYITQKERKYGGAEFRSVGFPPEYDPNQETIKSIIVDKKKASIFTNKMFANITREKEYKFKLVGDKWLIDVMKEFDTYGKKWRSVTIL